MVKKDIELDIPTKPRKPVAPKKPIGEATIKKDTVLWHKSTTSSTQVNLLEVLEKLPKSKTLDLNALVLGVQLKNNGYYGDRKAEVELVYEENIPNEKYEHSLKDYNVKKQKYDNDMVQYKNDLTKYTETKAMYLKNKKLIDATSKNKKVKGKLDTIFSVVANTEPVVATA